MSFKNLTDPSDDLPTADPETETHPLRPKSIVPPPNNTAWAIRSRLTILFAMLILVVVAMREAGKPERWNWLLGDQSAELATDERLAGKVSSQSTDPQPTHGTSDSEPGLPNAAIGAGASMTLIKPSLSMDEPPTYPAAASDFWAMIMRKLDTEQQRDWFRLLKSVRCGKPIDSDRRIEIEKLVEIVSHQRELFHRDRFDQLAVLADGTEEKTKRANELYESEQMWDAKILPALTAVLAGNDFTVSQLQQIERLQLVLDPLILMEVQDHTTIGWEGDSAAWVRLWERVRDPRFPASNNTSNRLAEATPVVSHLQLSSQPDFYRGKPITVRGRVLSARQEMLDDSELGVPHYFVLWLQPADSNVAPYCIYALELPVGFPPVSERFSKHNQPIEATGLFFKIRTFVDGSNQVSESPVILTNQLTMTEDNTDSLLSVSNFRLPLQAWIGFLVLMPLVAATIAWLIFRGSETRRYQPGALMTKKINRGLQALTRDPGVQSDVEKIQDLYD
jgi:hypothetical protein